MARPCSSVSRGAMGRGYPAHGMSARRLSIVRSSTLNGGAGAGATALVVVVLGARRAADGVADGVEREGSAGRDGLASDRAHAATATTLAARKRTELDDIGRQDSPAARRRPS